MAVHPLVEKIIGIDGSTSALYNARLVEMQPNFQMIHLKLVTQPGRMQCHDVVSSMKVALADIVVSGSACFGLEIYTSAHTLRR